MVYKTGKLKGELTGAEIRKLIRAHNILADIKIPKGTDRSGLIKLIENKGYKIDHNKGMILDSRKDRPRRKKITIEQAKELTKPKPLTEEQKKKRQQTKQRRKGEQAFLKKAIPKPPPVSKQSKGIKVGKPPPKPKKEEPKKEEPKKNELQEVKKILKKIDDIRSIVYEKRFNLAGLRKTLKVKKDFEDMSNELNKMQQEANKEQRNLRKYDKVLRKNEELGREAVVDKQQFETRIRGIMKNMKKVFSELN